jgi:hypothetical protein
MLKRQVSRRQFMHLSAAASAGAVLVVVAERPHPKRLLQPRRARLQRRPRLPRRHPRLNSKKRPCWQTWSPMARCRR